LPCGSEIFKRLIQHIPEFSVSGFAFERFVLLVKVTNTFDADGDKVGFLAEGKHSPVLRLQ
jgi:hypothetical protein